MHSYNNRSDRGTLLLPDGKFFFINKHVLVLIAVKYVKQKDHFWLLFSATVSVLTLKCLTLTESQCYDYERKTTADAKWFDKSA